MHSFFPLVEAFFNIFPRFWFSTYKRWRDDSGSREPFFFFFLFLPKVSPAVFEVEICTARYDMAFFFLQAVWPFLIQVLS